MDAKTPRGAHPRSAETGRPAVFVSACLSECLFLRVRARVGVSVCGVTAGRKCWSERHD